MKKSCPKLSEKVQIKWQPKLLARLRAFADDREITLSEAVRRLVDQGLPKDGEA